mgnify:CR=1 FL=1
MKSLFLSVLLSVTTILSAQWAAVTNFSGANRYAAMNFTIQNTAYIVGGLRETLGGFVAYNQLWKYDATNDTWSQEMNYPGGNIFGGVAFVIDSIAYVGLGSNENGVRGNQLWAFNPANGQWTKKANLPGNGRTYPFYFALNGKGYVGGGDRFNGSTRIYMNDFWEYDPSTDVWTNKSDFPTAGRVGMTGMSIGSRAYAGLGDDGSFFYNDFYEYSAVLNTWNPSTSFPGSNRSFCSSVTVGGVGYLMGGEDITQNYTRTMWSFDTSGTWAPSYNFAGDARASANFFYVDQSFYYGLGLTAASGTNATNRLWKYDLGMDLNTELLQSLKLYPNPANEKLSISLDEPLRNGQISIVNAQGVLIQVHRFEDASSVNLDVKTLENGLYFVKIQSGGKTHYERFIKE